MKREGDQRLYLTERGPKGEPRVIPVWGQRGTTGFATYTRLRRDDRQWEDSSKIFDTELQAWRFIETVILRRMDEARAILVEGKTLLPGVRAHLKQGTPKTKDVSNPRVSYITRRKATKPFL